MRRVHFSSILGVAYIRVLLTVLTVLPSFPLLSHFAFQCEYWTNSLYAWDDETEDCVVNAVYGCLVSLPQLTSLDLGWVLPQLGPTQGRRRWGDEQFAFDVLSKLLRERLLHASIKGNMFLDWFNLHAQTLVSRQSHEAQLPALTVPHCV